MKLMVVPFADTLHTPRMMLRRPTLDDADALYRGVTSQPEVSRWLTWRPHESPDVTRDVLTHVDREWERGASATWVMALDGAPDPVGMFSAWPGKHGVELGFTLAPGLWGRGLMTEAVGAVARHLITQEGRGRVWATCDVEHAASRKVLEKAGFLHEGVMRHHAVHPNIEADPRDSHVYALTARDV